MNKGKTRQRVKDWQRRNAAAAQKRVAKMEEQHDRNVAVKEAQRARPLIGRAS